MTHRPAIEALLLQLAGKPDSLAYTHPVGVMRDVLKWALHLESRLTNSDTHCVVEHAGHELAYELSPAGHLLWVSWHRHGDRTQPPHIAAVRLRNGWQLSSEAPFDVTSTAIEQLTGERHGTGKSKQPVVPPTHRLPNKPAEG